MFVNSLIFALSARWQDYNTIDLRQYPTTLNNSTAGTLAEAIGMPTGMLPMLDAADPNDRAFKLATICVCVVSVSVGYLVHNPHIVTRMVELRVIIIVFLVLTA